ncbi:MAG: alkaline phosphatase PhoX [Gemmatimonadota bacterium]
MDRRTFVKRGMLAGGALAVPGALGGLARLSRGLLPPDAAAVPPAGLGDGGYGPLVPAGDELALPRGFTYRRFGTAGDPMSDGNLTPIAHDGMGAFATPGGKIRLLRNHEEDSGPIVAPIAAENAYDPRAGAGVVTLEVDPESRELLRDFCSLNGTAVNCAGGETPWGSWLSCEETGEGPAQGFGRRHGYVFEVPSAAEGPVEPVPLRAMGRFEHEAVMVDPASGIVYLTEDIAYDPDDGLPGSGFYRFLPDRPGDLAAGGRLQVLAVEGAPGYLTVRGQRVGDRLPVTWLDLDDPDPPEVDADSSALFRHALELGAAIFHRLEGAFWADGGGYFDATTGGDARRGQIWQYRPLPDGRGELRLAFESPGPSVLNSPDNLCVSPRGGLVICEDPDGAAPFLRGLTPDGRIFDLAHNITSETEFTGACFSPDGRTLFVNFQGPNSVTERGDPGFTVAIWGPWERGAL